MVSSISVCLLCAVRRSLQGCRCCAVYTGSVQRQCRRRKSRRVLIVLRVQPGGVSCHHPDHLFTRVSNARVVGEKSRNVTAGAGGPVTITGRQIHCVRGLSALYQPFRSPPVEMQHVVERNSLGTTEGRAGVLSGGDGRRMIDVVGQAKDGRAQQCVGGQVDDGVIAHVGRIAVTSTSTRR